MNTNPYIIIDSIDAITKDFHKSLTDMIKDCMKKKGISNYLLCKDLFFSESSFKILMSGKKSMNTRTLLKILAYLKIKLCIDARGVNGSIINIKLIKE